MDGEASSLSTTGTVPGCFGLGSVKVQMLNQPSILCEDLQLKQMPYPHLTLKKKSAPEK
jgi:ribosome-interacting GTPase 1